MLWHEEAIVRATASVALGRVGNEAESIQTSLLCKLADEEASDSHRAAAGETLGRLGVDAAISLCVCVCACACVYTYMNVCFYVCRA